MRIDQPIAGLTLVGSFCYITLLFLKEKLVCFWHAL
jgi:hypothetical protein